MRQALDAAARDAGGPGDGAALRSRLERIAVPHGRWDYGDPGRLLAAHAGAPGTTTVLAEVGVLQQTLIGECAGLIAEGEISEPAVVGGEAGHRLSRAARAGITITDTEDAGRRRAPRRRHRAHPPGREERRAQPGGERLRRPRVRVPVPPRARGGGVAGPDRGAVRAVLPDRRGQPGCLAAPGHRRPGYPRPLPLQPDDGVPLRPSRPQCRPAAVTRRGRTPRRRLGTATRSGGRCPQRLGRRAPARSLSSPRAGRPPFPTARRRRPCPAG